MEQVSIHIKKFNDRVKVMNQTNAKDLILSKVDAQNLQAEIFELLVKVSDLVETKKEGSTPAAVSVDFDGGGF